MGIKNSFKANMGVDKNPAFRCGLEWIESSLAFNRELLLFLPHLERRQ